MKLKHIPPQINPANNRERESSGINQKSGVLAGPKRPLKCRCVKTLKGPSAFLDGHRYVKTLKDKIYKVNGKNLSVTKILLTTMIEDQKNGGHPQLRI